MNEKIPCPFVYADGHRCSGFIVRVAAYEADVEWYLDEQGRWTLSVTPNRHYQLFCSEKGNHAGLQSDSTQLKFRPQDLPERVQRIVFRSFSTGLFPRRR